MAMMKRLGEKKTEVEELKRQNEVLKKRAEDEG